MPMGHLKECPWDKNAPWRPAVVELATTTFDQREDAATARNLFKFGTASPKVMQPMGMEETVRMAVRSRDGSFPAKQDLRSASYLPGGWEDYGRLNKPDFTKSFSYIRKGCRIDSVDFSRPQTAGTFDDRDVRTPPAAVESLETLATRTFSRLSGGPGSPTATMRMQASMPYIRAKSTGNLTQAAEPSIYCNLTREKAVNASINSTFRFER
mmetsp:Transcript_57599/g.134963  ORF Transcript_57599/g.134963 Transcript_57599/m.134963 type:complete len:211 (+) Transcript_57599:95-727(+)